MFTDKLPVFSEVVLAVPVKDPENPRIHSLWPCNVVNNIVITLKNFTTVPDAQKDEVEEICWRAFENWNIRERFWTPLNKDSPPIKVWKNSMLKHNFHEGRILRQDYFQHATSLASSHINQLPEFIREFKAELRTMMDTGVDEFNNPFSAEVDAFKLFTRKVQAKFNKEIRVEVISDKTNGTWIELGFLYNPSDVFVDHPNRYPRVGDVTTFYKFFVET